MLLVFLNAYRNNPQAHGITVVAFHPEVFTVSYFPQGTEVNLLSSSSKETQGQSWQKVEMIPMVKSLMIDKLYFHLLTLGPKRTWCTRRYQHAALCHIRTQGITRDRQGYHHLPPTPQPWDMRQTKVSSSLDTMSTLSTITLAPYRVIRLYQEPSTRVSAMGTNDEPASKQ